MQESSSRRRDFLARSLNGVDVMDDIEVFEQAPEMFMIGCGFQPINTKGIDHGGFAKSENRMLKLPLYVWTGKRWWWQGGQAFKIREDAEKHLDSHRVMLSNAPLPSRRRA